MKRCPQCNQTFGEDDLFCVDDGSTLEPVRDEFQQVAETVTQVVSNPQLPVQATAADNSKFLYGIIGGLVAVILLMGGYFLLLRPTSTADRVVTADNKSSNSESSAPAETTPIIRAANNRESQNVNSAPTLTDVSTTGPDLSSPANKRNTSRDKHDVSRSEPRAIVNPNGGAVFMPNDGGVVLVPIPANSKPKTNTPGRLDPPRGAIFLCKDGTYSFSRDDNWACTGHGGVGRRLSYQ